MTEEKEMRKYADQNETVLEELANLNSFQEQLTALDSLQTYIENKAHHLLKLEPEESYESLETNKINEALAKAQGEFPPVGRNQSNYYDKGYADLNNIMLKIRPYLSKNGLSITQQTLLSKEGVTVLKTKIRHTSGQFIETRARVIPEKNNMQSYGSALTYLRRYQIMALLNVTITDDYCDDDAEIEMQDYRVGVAKGTNLTTQYPLKRKTPGVFITKEQLNELEYELKDYPDVAEDVLKGLKIQALADMPKDLYSSSIRRVREIKNSREGRAPLPITKEK